MSKLRDISPTALIAAYGKAYQEANAKEPPSVTYVQGWFVIRDPLPTRRRRADLIEMIGRLRSRVESPTPPAQPEEKTT